MHPRRHIAVAAALLVAGGGVYAQVLDVSAGTSTAYDSSGATLRWRSRGTDATFGFGVIAGSFSMGGAMVRSTKDGSVTVGQQGMPADLPTDIFENRHTLLGTGIGIRHNGADNSFTGFSGFTSRGSGTPLFTATTLDRTTHFAQWTTRLNRTCKQVVTIAAGHAALGIASFACKQQRSAYAVSAGGTYGGAYAAASYAFEGKALSLKAAAVYAGPHFQRNFSAAQPVPEPVRENVAAIYRPTPHWAFQAAHGQYVTQAFENSGMPADGNNAYRSALDSVSAQFEQHNLMASTTLLRSSYATDTTGTPADTLQAMSTAVSSSLRYSTGRLTLTQMLMASRGSSGRRTALAVTSAEVAVNSRLRLTESVNLTRDGLSMSHGGSLLTRYSSFDVGYQFFYVANQPSRPFQQALLFRADVQLPGIDLRASSSISPTGQPQYTFQLARSFSHAPAESTPHITIGRHIIRGRVEDDTGAGVSRAALLIDKDRVYTGPDGYFLYREQHKTTHFLEVLTTEFVEPFRYEVRDAPYRVTSSTSGQLVRIVVQKRRATP